MSFLIIYFISHKSDVYFFPVVFNCFSKYGINHYFEEVFPKWIFRFSSSLSIEVNIFFEAKRLIEF